jgi:hypothetical protein
VIGIVFDSSQPRGELRASFDGGTTDAVAWFSLDEARAVPHVDLVDFVLDRL